MPALPPLRELRDLPPDEQDRIISKLTPKQLEGLLSSWEFTARDDQLPPAGEWFVWMALCGMGWGKTLAGNQWINLERAEAHARGEHLRICLLGATANDVLGTMLYGKSGLCNVGPEKDRPRPIENKRLLEWACGCTGQYFSAEEPERLRGPEFNIAFADELATFPNLEQTWALLKLRIRIGDRPRIFVATTPKPLKVLRGIQAESQLPGSRVVVTRGSSFDNRPNLAADYFRTIAQYDGTRLGRQEIYGEILDDEGVLFNPSWFRYKNPHREDGKIVSLDWTVVAIDPAVTANKDSDETGIIVVARTKDGLAYVLEDLSGKYTPEQWARIAIDAYQRHGARRLIAETNQGGDLVANTLRSVGSNINYTGVHATKGKIVRAEPVAALYERGLIYHPDHVNGSHKLQKLEDQLADFPHGSKSPDRLDALCYALHALMLGDLPSARGLFTQRIGYL